MVNIHAAVVGIPANSTLDDRLRGVGQDVLGWQQRLARMGVAGHRISVTRGATCTRDDVLRAVDALARQLAADPDAAGLLVMAGHGGEHGALLHCADGALTVDQVTTQLDATLPGRGIAAIFDVCPVAQATARPVALRDCDVVLADSDVSRHHAQIVGTGGGWTIRDLGSTNGLRVDGRAVGAEPARLAPGAAIEIGTVRAQFEVG